MTYKEVSAQFVPPEKFSAVCADLQSPACTVATLRLFHNEPEHTAAMLAALAHNTSVVDFDISELDAQGAALLEAWLSSSQTLKGLTVHHMHCAPAVARAASGIASSHALTSLHLSGLDAVGISAFARALANWSPSRLQSFTLQASSFTGEAAAHLGEALASQAGALKSMTVTSSHLADQVAASLLAPLAHVAAAGLVSLNLSANRIAAEGAAQLGKLLECSSTLTELNLKSNNLSNSGCACLSAGLARSPSLKALDLCENAVGPEGAVELANGVQANSSLTSLHLSDNAVGAAGLMALLVKAGRSLTELTLERNIIRGADLIKLLPASEPSDAAAGHTSAAAWSSTSSPLQRLMLANNSLLDAGTQAVCRHLQASCPEFSALDLTGCGVGEEGLSSVLALLAARPRMRELNLEHNRIHNSGAQSLLHALPAHNGLWCFRADFNKLTDPALKSSLHDAGQRAAARRAQAARRAAQGRTSQDSSSSDDELPAGYQMLQAQRNAAAAAAAADAQGLPSPGGRHFHYHPPRHSGSGSGPASGSLGGVAQSPGGSGVRGMAATGGYVQPETNRGGASGSGSGPQSGSVHGNGGAQCQSQQQQQNHHGKHARSDTMPRDRSDAGSGGADDEGYRSSEARNVYARLPSLRPATVAIPVASADDASATAVVHSAYAMGGPGGLSLDIKGCIAKAAAMGGADVTADGGDGCQAMALSPRGSGGPFDDGDVNMSPVREQQWGWWYGGGGGGGSGMDCDHAGRSAHDDAMLAKPASPARAAPLPHDGMHDHDHEADDMVMHNAFEFAPAAHDHQLDERTSRVGSSAGGGVVAPGGSGGVALGGSSGMERGGYGARHEAVASRPQCRDSSGGGAAHESSSALMTRLPPATGAWPSYAAPGGASNAINIYTSPPPHHYHHHDGSSSYCLSASSSLDCGGAMASAMNMMMGGGISNGAAMAAAGSAALATSPSAHGSAFPYAYAPYAGATGAGCHGRPVSTGSAQYGGSLPSGGGGVPSSAYGSGMADGALRSASSGSAGAAITGHAVKRGLKYKPLTPEQQRLFMDF